MTPIEHILYEGSEIFPTAIIKTEGPVITQNHCARLTLALPSRKRVDQNHASKSIPCTSSQGYYVRDHNAGVFIYFDHAMRVSYGFSLFNLEARKRTLEYSGSPSGLWNNLCLHPLRVIEQIIHEQLLPVKMTCFHFIAMDTRSDSICTLQLSAILISLPIPAFNTSWQT